MSDTEILDRPASLQLAGTVGLGRVAWADRSGRVNVQPVNFMLDGESVVFRTGEGEKLDAVRRGCRFSFEVDDVEPALRMGWSVLISGPASVVTATREVSHLDELTVSPWDSATPKSHYVRIRAEHVSGRRLPLHPGGVSVVHPDRS